MAKYLVNYNGLRRRDTFEDAVDYLEYGYKQDVIKYPDRKATQIMNSPAMMHQQLLEMEYDEDKFKHKRYNFNFADDNYDRGIQATLETMNQEIDATTTLDIHRHDKAVKMCTEHLGVIYDDDENDDRMDGKGGSRIKKALSSTAQALGTGANAIGATASVIGSVGQGAYYATKYIVGGGQEVGAALGLIGGSSTSPAASVKKGGGSETSHHSISSHSSSASSAHPKAKAKAKPKTRRTQAELNNDMAVQFLHQKHDTTLDRVSKTRSGKI